MYGLNRIKNNKYISYLDRFELQTNNLNHLYLIGNHRETQLQQPSDATVEDQDPRRFQPSTPRLTPA